jgi:hypothetical protein
MDIQRDVPDIMISTLKPLGRAPDIMELPETTRGRSLYYDNILGINLIT